MPFPINLSFAIPYLYNSQQISIALYTGATILVGPNGSGKTQVLKTLKQVLAPHAAGRKIRYLSANRLTAIEQYRSNVNGQGYNDARHATVGRNDFLPSRHLAETAVGDFLTLTARPDVRIKIKERLETLFKREIILEWNTNGLKVDFVPTGGSSYSAVHEASGLLNLVSLLSALYDDEVGVLLIDEPEVSLHPQLQTFYNQEISKVAGDP